MKKFLIALNVVIWSLVGYEVAHANPIDQYCPQHVVWGAPQIHQEGNNQYLCRQGYAVNYNYNTKVAYFVVETIWGQSLASKAAVRGNDFREDTDIPPQYRQTLKDYVNYGLDRGHMATAADFVYSPLAMSESFLL